MVFGDNVKVDKADGMDDTEDNQTSYWNIVIISAMIMLILIPGEFFGDDTGNIDNKNNNADYVYISTRRAWMEEKLKTGHASAKLGTWDRSSCPDNMVIWFYFVVGEAILKW